MRILVLGGAGYIGRHVAAALAARGHAVIIASRRPDRAARRLPARLHGCERREAHCERLLCPQAWRPLLEDVETVVNAVGILRQRGAETYARVHHLAPAALAAACARRAIRLVHVSALGLRSDAQSGFIRSKLAGERAIAACGSGYSIVRPSLLDGGDGFGARWFHRVARWPLHFVPADATGRIAVLDVRDLGEAIAALCEQPGGDRWREVELGGRTLYTVAEYLAALRAPELPPARVVRVPAILARAVSHLCDLAHFSPFSYGHLQLLRHDNVPRMNDLPTLLGRGPAAVGYLPAAPASGFVVGLGKPL